MPPHPGNTQPPGPFDPDGPLAMTQADLEHLLDTVDEVEWRIIESGGEPPVLEVGPESDPTGIVLDRDTTRDMLAGLRTVDTWHRRQLREHALPPESDPTARLRARFDPARIRDWWHDPENHTRRIIVTGVIAVIILVVILGLI